MASEFGGRRERILNHVIKVLHDVTSFTTIVVDTSNYFILVTSASTAYAEKVDMRRVVCMHCYTKDKKVQMKQHTLAMAADQGDGFELYRRQIKQDTFLATM